MPILHRLQEAFLVYEDQLTADWERGWYIFSSEWPQVAIDPSLKKQCAEIILLRTLESQIFASLAQLKDWSSWSLKELQELLSELEKKEKVVKITIAGLGEGWVRSEDMQLNELDLPPSVFMLHKADPLVRSHVSELKKVFQGQEVLQYLLIDGTFQGAVLGHWRIGPHDVEDILLNLSTAVAKSRRTEIIAAVNWGYRPPFSNINKYNGEKIT